MTVTEQLTGVLESIGLDASCLICGFRMDHPGPRGPSRLMLLIAWDQRDQVIAQPVHSWCAYRAEELPVSPDDPCTCGHPAQWHEPAENPHACTATGCACPGWLRAGTRAFVD